MFYNTEELLLPHSVSLNIRERILYSVKGQMGWDLQSSSTCSTVRNLKVPHKEGGDRTYVNSSVDFMTKEG